KMTTKRTSHLRGMNQVAKVDTTSLVQQMPYA
ncbi:50S ribosomal protein L35, partial [Francisella tularensis subsp. holarctica]|nr:50S ribosomal protein L35 [Francisella tularensis subsp. holarctica]